MPVYVSDTDEKARAEAKNALLADFLDGMLNYSVGNVFGKHLEDFHPSLLRQSFGFGFAANTSRDHNFEFLLGLGTETFDQGSSVDTFRFVIGASEGF